MGKKRKGNHEAAEERLEDGPREDWTQDQHNKHAESSAQAAGFNSVEDQVRHKDEQFAIFQAEREAKRSKGGRPKSDRDDVPVKIDRQLAKLALHVANDRDIGVSEYLSETFREVISRDAAEVARKIVEGTK